LQRQDIYPGSVLQTYIQFPSKSLEIYHYSWSWELQTQSCTPINKSLC